MLSQPSEELKKIAVRIPDWYCGRDSILKGILYYIRSNDNINWQLDIPRKSDGELPEVIIDKHWQGDGVISFRFDEDEISAFRDGDIKLVNVSSVISPDVTTVKADNIQAGKVAAKHFIDLGLKKIIYIGREGRQYSEDRWLGLKEVCERGGVEAEKHVNDVNALPVTQRSKFLKDQFVKLLPSITFPIGVFASDDILAGNITYACNDLKIKIPRDVALIGVNNNPLFCLSLTPPLTSVDIPNTSIGYKAAEAMHHLLLGTSYPEMTIIPVEQIKTRVSTNTLAYHDERIKKAVEFIRHQSPIRPIKVLDVCQAAGISQSTLKTLMAKTLGKSPKKEIDDVRISTFREHLISTEKSIGEIGYAMGFHASEEASRFFRKMSGMTPTEFRKQHR